MTRVLHPTFNSGFSLGAVPPRKADGFREMPKAATKASEDVRALQVVLGRVNAHHPNELSADDWRALKGAATLLNAIANQTYREF